MLRPIPILPFLAVLSLGACSADNATGAAGPTDGEAPAVAYASDHSAWSTAVRLDLVPGAAHPDFNTAFLDGCPLPSRDGKLFFIASTRPGSQGIDIWVSRRAQTDDPWGQPERLPAPINTEHNDFCPMLARDGQTFYFVSNRPVADVVAGTPACGGTDIYVSRMRQDGAFDAPRNLGCTVNSRWDEAGPVPVNEPGRGPTLYFSSTRRGGVAPDGGTPESAGDADLYFTVSRGGEFATADLVPGVNSAQEDAQPYIRDDARELFFFSNRVGSTANSNDLWVATRARAQDAWSPPTTEPLTSVNSANPETRPSLSPDGLTLYFGSVRPAPEGKGMSDVYRATRVRRP